MESTDTSSVLFFCYLSRGFIQTRNRQVGMICSTRYIRLAEYPKFGEPDATYFQFIPNPDFSGTLSLFQMSVTQWYSVEFNLEQARLKFFPQCPSRLSAIYVFDSRAEAEKADKVYGFSKERDLVKLRPVNPHILCNYCRHDMRFIDALRNPEIHAWENLEEALKSYWAGLELRAYEFQNKRIESDPIWEVLYDGALEFVD